jgi:hypothetical protein
VMAQTRMFETCAPEEIPNSEKLSELLPRVG